MGDGANEAVTAVANLLPLLIAEGAVLIVVLVALPVYAAHRPRVRNDLSLKGRVSDVWRGCLARRDLLYRSGSGVDGSRWVHNWLSLRQRRIGESLRHQAGNGVTSNGGSACDDTTRPNRKP